MNVYKLNYKRISLWIFIIIQLILVISYYYVQKGENEEYSDGKISFLQSERLFKHTNRTYHTQGDRINLLKHKVRDEFIDFNSSLCFVNGTDLSSMNRLKHSWTCKCKSGWHGPECGQPEVVWRALLTYRKKLNIKGPRAFARRLLYIFQVNEFVENLVDIRLNELQDVVDLFILIENKGNILETFLKNSHLKKFHKKILYIKNVDITMIWQEISSNINLQNDDIVLLSKSFEIPNKFALSFLKYYDNWPEPITFRLRWSVFGFFWRHPNKTKTRSFACSVKFVQKSTFKNLYSSKNISGLILGDLNHFGGWYCEYCMEPNQVIKFANERSDVKLVTWKTLNKDVIDVGYIEDLIGNGLYVDGKTELERSRKYLDNYFAPSYVLENSMKFDYLLVNLYTKLDYYEG